MAKYYIFILLIFLNISCKNQEHTQNHRILSNDTIIDNKTNDNKSIKKEITDETVIDIFTNNNGEVVTKIYKINSKTIPENKENSKILQLLSKYNDNKCISWIAGALKQYDINDNLADTYIKYNDIYLYEPVVLHIGLICENIDVINMLIDFGADIYAEDSSGENILMLAEKINNEEIINIITKEYENGF